LQGAHDCAITCRRLPNTLWKVTGLDMYEASHCLRWAKISIEAPIHIMVTTLESHDLFPFSVSDTLPGFTLSRLPISA
jgi:hypothetical protein